MKKEPRSVGLLGATAGLLTAAASHSPSLLGKRALLVHGRMRMRRRLRQLLLLFLVLLLGLVGIARYYLQSRQLAHQVAEQLSARLGGNVKVGSVDIGVSGTTLEKIELQADGSAAAGPPWLAVESVEADVGLFAFLKGDAMPAKVTARGVVLTLQLDEQGQLATTFPTLPGKEADDSPLTSFPEVKLTNSRIVFQRPGMADFTITDVETQLHAEGEPMRLTGKAKAEPWGDWALGGSLDLKSKTATLTLTPTAAVQATPAKLRALPFVPAHVWTEIQAQGETTATVLLKYDWERRQLSYRVELQPQGAEVSMPSVPLQARKATGTIVIEDHVVTLRRVHGEVSGGVMSADGVLDFRTGTPRLQFERIEMNKLQIAQLPKQWNFPAQIQGRLSGHAKLAIVLVPGQPQVHGSGEATVDVMRLDNQPVVVPLHMRIQPTAEGLRWQEAP